MKQELISLEMLKKIVSKIKYKDWTFHLDKMEKGFYVQVRFNEADIRSGKIELQHGRKWYISPFVTEDEIVRTCFLAVLTASEHEIREQFSFENNLVFGPHIAVKSLVGVASKKVLRQVQEATR